MIVYNLPKCKTCCCRFNCPCSFMNFGLGDRWESYGNPGEFHILGKDEKTTRMLITNCYYCNYDGSVMAGHGIIVSREFLKAVLDKNQEVLEEVLAAVRNGK